MNIDHSLVRAIGMISVLAAGATVCLPSAAAINYLPGSSIFSFSTTGNGAISPPPVFGTSLFDTVDGLKVSSYTLTYAANPVDNGKALEIDWIANRSLVAFGGPTPLTHVNHLDGTVNFSGGFAVGNVSLRTITTATDSDLNALNLGPLSSGDSFDKTLAFGPFSQIDGNDRVISFFKLSFTQSLTATAADTLELSLPSSAQSTAGVVPLPASAWLLSFSLGGLGFARRRAF